ncbi:MAG TPA: transaldolase family protein [Planctomycetia bacterium]|nr:transaldolase family protein [Planctomycetia bacterium]
MSSPLRSLIAAGTKLYLDSIDPDLVVKNRAMGATGATSNPIIVSDLMKTGRFDSQVTALAKQGLDAESIAWQMTDRLVRQAQEVFLPVWTETKGNEGWVSFELDPLLEDKVAPPHDERVAKYVELGKKWSAGHQNRMIKVPATPAGLAALEELAAHGVTLNVTLIFSRRQYLAARDAIWRGARRRKDGLAGFKSVYSIFVSRLDVYTEKLYPQLSAAAQGMVGIVNAKRIWAENQAFWKQNKTPLEQEMIFASTGTKKPNDPAWKYVEAFAGSDIETNPPKTNDDVEKSGRMFTRHVDSLPAAEVLAEIDKVVDLEKLERDLMAEGLEKFADPQKALIALIQTKLAG